MWSSQWQPKKPIRIFIDLSKTDAFARPDGFITGDGSDYDNDGDDDRNGDIIIESLVVCNYNKSMIVSWSRIFTSIGKFIIIID